MILKKLFLGALMTTMMSAPLIAQEFPYSPVDNTPISAWCSNITYELNIAKAHALTLTQYGDYKQSIEELMGALEQGIQNKTPYTIGALTYKTLGRSLAMAQELMATAKTNQEYRQINFFLMRYFDYISQVSHELDIPYYNNQCHFGYCMPGPNMEEELERNYIKFSFYQVDLILKNFATTNGHMIYPLGPAKNFLKTLGRSLQYASSDLTNSLFANYYACSIQSISTLASKIDTYLSTGKGFINEVYAVQESFMRAQNAINNPHCGFNTPYNLQ